MDVGQERREQVARNVVEGGEGSDRVAGTLVVTGLATAYILWRIDLGQTGHVLAHASPGWWLASLAIWVASVWPLSWRWLKLLASSGVHEPLGWLVRTTFVSYAAAQ